MPEITGRVETAMLHWELHEVVTVEHTDYVDLLIAAGRLTPLASDLGEVVGDVEDVELDEDTEEAGEGDSELLVAEDDPVAAAP